MPWECVWARAKLDHISKLTDHICVHKRTLFSKHCHDKVIINTTAAFCSRCGRTLRQTDKQTNRLIIRQLDRCFVGFRWMWACIVACIVAVSLHCSRLCVPQWVEDYSHAILESLQTCIYTKRHPRITRDWLIDLSMQFFSSSGLFTVGRGLQPCSAKTGDNHAL